MLLRRRQQASFPSIQTFLVLLGALSSRTLAQDNDDGSSGSDPLGIGNNGGGQLSNSGGNGGSSSNSYNNSNKPLYLIILVVVVILGIGVAVVMMARRRKRLAYTARARQVSDMEAARGQRSLTGWRVTGGWHASGGTGVGSTSIPLSPTTGRSTRTALRPAPPQRVEGLDENGEAPPPYSPPANRAADKELFPAERRRDSGITTPETELGSPTDDRPRKSEDGDGIQRPEPAHRR